MSSLLWPEARVVSPQIFQELLLIGFQDRGIEDRVN
jgi:hypothetical protein